jgi:biotin synthase
MTIQADPPVTSYAILEIARKQVLEDGVGLTESQLVEVLKLPDEALPAALQLAHEVRLRHCGEDVEVEGIISIKTGGCPEDCHFCSQSGLFDSPVATEFCIVAAVRGPDIKLMNQIKFAIDRINEAVDINIACSLGMLTQRQVDQLAEWGVHRYNHNLETARSYFSEVVTTHSYEERLETCNMVKDAGMELCCGALIGMGESLEQRAELAAQLAALEPHEVPLNFLNPRPGTPLENQEIMDGKDALRAIAAFRLAMPRTVLRYAGGRELTLGDLGTREGLMGGINAVIVGNYLTTLGRPATADLNLLVELNMPIKELQKSL